MNIYQRINAVRKAIGYIQKDKSVSTGGGSYKAVTHDTVTGLIRQHLIEQGIIIVPDLVTGLFHPKEDGAKQRLYEATYVINFVNADQPEERVSMNVSAHALDNGDKAPGKALSYATKYGMLKMFSLETGEDEESRHQHEDFDPVPYLEKLEHCKSRDEMVPVYQEAKKAAFSAGDKAAIAAIDEVAKKMGAKFKAASELAGQA